jgi:pimeloyl-ACP methyl ester carboxylesterase
MNVNIKRVRGGKGRLMVAALVVLSVLLVAGVADASAARAGSSASSVTVKYAVPVPAASCAVKPTIVLVHGAWANAASWNGEIDRLQSDGYVVRAFANPLRGLTGDAANLRDFLRTISGPIVLVGHSYGGAVITNAAAGNLHVQALVYVDALAPAVGETVAELSGATSALRAPASTLYDVVPYPDASGGDHLLYLKERVFLQSFGPDVPTRMVEALWASQTPAAMSAFTTPSAAAAWQAIPSWYVIGTADKIVTPASELMMAHRANAHILLVPGGSHLTLISHPTEVTRQIVAAAQATCSSS